MNKKLIYCFLFFFIIVVGCIPCMGQQDSLPEVHSIRIEPKFIGADFYCQQNKIRMSKVLTLMENNDDAYDLMEKAHDSYIFGNLFCIIGTGLIAYPIIINILDESPRWAMAWSGCGMILVSIPIFHTYSKQSKEAVKIYNSSLKKKVSQPSTSMNFGITPNGLGLQLNF